MVLALGVVAVLGFRRWRAAALLFIGISVCSFANLSLAQESARVQAGSVISHAPLERIAVSRCGLRATLFALAYFDRRSNPSAVDGSLTPHWDGIALTEIVDVLTAHGLSVDVRKGVTLAQVAKAVTSTRMALLPVSMRNGWNHYYLATVDADGNVVIVDPPHGVYPWKQALQPEALEPTGGIVAFIETSAKPKSTDASRLSAAPPLFELGDMVVEPANGNRVKDVQLELKNNGRTPVFVAEVRKSCGCTEPSWRGGLIPAGSARSMALTVSPSSWGVGQQEKHLRFVMADGSDFVVTLRGRGITNAEAHGIAITAPSLTLWVDDSEPEESPDELSPDRQKRGGTTLRVRCLSAKPSDIQFDGNKDWLKIVASTKSGPEGDVVELTVSVDRELQRLDQSGIPAQLRVWTAANLDPVSLGVAVHRAPQLVAEPRSLKLNEAGFGICRIRPTGKRRIESHAEAVSSPAGVRLESTLGADGVLELRVTLADPKLPTKFFVVEVPVRLELGEAERAHFVVLR